MTRKRSGSSPSNDGSVPFPLDPKVWQWVAKEMQLSPQQQKIVELILRGRKDKEIAREMGLRIPTVRTYLQRIFLREGVRDRMELVLRVCALSHGIRSGSRDSS